MTEQEVLERVRDAAPAGDAVAAIQPILDSFSIDGPHGKHRCLLLHPLRETLLRFQSRFESNRLPLVMVKYLLVEILKSLDYLHTKCKLLHTGQYAD